MDRSALVVVWRTPFELPPSPPISPPFLSPNPFLPRPTSQPKQPDAPKLNMRPPPSKPSRLPRLLYLRSLVPPTIIYLVFLSTLAAYLLLVHAPLPGKSGRMSWQVDEGIQIFSLSAPEQVNETIGDGGEEEDEDGWAEVDGALPLEGWDPLLPHKTGRKSTPNSSPPSL